MNQDPNNLATPEATGFANPATATAPEAPTIDPSLLQQAIADVPTEATTNMPNAPTAIPIDNPMSNTSEAPAVDTSLFMGATPAADLSSSGIPMPDETAQKTTPSVAFNDPATQPDAPQPHQIKMPAFIDKLKKNPVALIIGGSFIIIIALVLIIAFVA